MARARRASRRRPAAADEPAAGGGTNDFLGQIALSETGNGFPFGPVEIALAIVAAVLIYPIARLVGLLRRR